jgi:hypothetical protein
MKQRNQYSTREGLIEGPLLPDVLNDTQALRNAISGIGLQHCISDQQSDGQKHLSKEDMAKLYKRCQRIRKGYIETRAWAENAGTPSLLEKPVQAHAFWHGTDSLPGQCFSGLQSAARVGGLEVHLWTYTNVCPLPAGVIRRDASTRLARELFQSAVDKDEALLPAMADLVRLGAMVGAQPNVNYVVLLDCDTLWLRHISALADFMQFGHVFASMERGRSQRAGGAVGYDGLLSWARWQRDNLHTATPILARVGSPWTKHVYQVLRARLLLEDLPTGPNRYNVAMDVMRDAVDQFGLSWAICPAKVFSPIPAFTGESCLNRPSGPNFDPFEIGSNPHCVGVNAFWQSSRNAQTDALVRGCLTRAKDGSAWAALLEMAATRGQEPPAAPMIGRFQISPTHAVWLTII